MKTKPVIGQTVFSLPIGGASRDLAKVLTPTKVTKVGKKFFYTDEGSHWRPKQYRLSDWGEQSSYVSTKLYETREEWADETERGDLKKRMRIFFAGSAFSQRANLSLVALREIAAILAREAQQKLAEGKA